MGRPVIQRLFRGVRARLRDFGIGARRSSKWPTVEKAFVERNRVCEACGDSKNLQVHHKLPFHLHPELELDPTNLVSLCMGDNACHLLIGHGNDFRAYNPHLNSLLKALRNKKMKLPVAQVVALKARVYR